MFTCQAERSHHQTIHSLTQKLKSRRALRDPKYAENIHQRIERAKYFYRRIPRPQKSVGAW